jgi:hypothetical protein
MRDPVKEWENATLDIANVTRYIECIIRIKLTIEDPWDRSLRTLVSYGDSAGSWCSLLISLTYPSVPLPFLLHRLSFRPEKSSLRWCGASPAYQQRMKAGERNISSLVQRGLVSRFLAS